MFQMSNLTFSFLEIEDRYKIANAKNLKHVNFKHAPKTARSDQKTFKLKVPVQINLERTNNPVIIDKPDARMLNTRLTLNPNAPLTNFIGSINDRLKKALGYGDNVQLITGSIRLFWGPRCNHPNCVYESVDNLKIQKSYESGAGIACSINNIYCKNVTESDFCDFSKCMKETCKSKFAEQRGKNFLKSLVGAFDTNKKIYRLVFVMNNINLSKKAGSDSFYVLYYGTVKCMMIAESCERDVDYLDESMEPIVCNNEVESEEPMLEIEEESQIDVIADALNSEKTSATKFALNMLKV